MTNQKSLDKKKTKELDWEKELDKMFFIKMGKLKGFAKPIWDWEKPKLVNLINALLTQQRTELLDEQFEKSETEAEIASKAYDQGYLDCQKGRKKSPHDTRDGYCCACDYDLVCFEGKLKEARTELLDEILNLECLKEEDGENAKYGIKGFGLNNTQEQDARNQLREEIIEEIKKL